MVSMTSPGSNGDAASCVDVIDIKSICRTIAEGDYETFTLLRVRYDGCERKRRSERAHYCDVLKLIENPTGVASTEGTWVDDDIMMECE